MMRSPFERVLEVRISFLPNENHPTAHAQINNPNSDYLPDWQAFFVDWWTSADLRDDAALKHELRSQLAALKSYNELERLLLLQLLQSAELTIIRGQSAIPFSYSSLAETLHDPIIPGKTISIEIVVGTNHLVFPEDAFPSHKCVDWSRVHAASAAVPALASAVIDVPSAGSLIRTIDDIDSTAPAASPSTPDNFTVALAAFNTPSSGDAFNDTPNNSDSTGSADFFLLSPEVRWWYPPWRLLFFLRSALDVRRVPRQNETDTTGKKIVLSTRFSLDKSSLSEATSFTSLFKKHEYIQNGNFKVHSPNAFDKKTCDPNWTDFDHQCRGTTDTCTYNNALTQEGHPTDDCCWRFSFRRQLEEAKATGGFMLQLVETAEEHGRVEEARLGKGQAIERDMAEQLGLKIFHVYRPTLFFEFEDDFNDLRITDVISAIKRWYENQCKNKSLCVVKP